MVIEGSNGTDLRRKWEDVVILEVADIEIEWFRFWRLRKEEVKRKIHGACCVCVSMERPKNEEETVSRASGYCFVICICCPPLFKLLSNTTDLYWNIFSWTRQRCRYCCLFTNYNHFILFYETLVLSFFFFFFCCKAWTCKCLRWCENQEVAREDDESNFIFFIN